jgi:hypothetical protein
MDKVLSQLEAAMLGLYLMGVGEVRACNPAQLQAYDSMSIISNSLIIDMTYRNGDLPESVGSEAGGYNVLLNISDWLTEHSITPPEVSA